MKLLSLFAISASLVFSTLHAQPQNKELILQPPPADMSKPSKQNQKKAKKNKKVESDAAKAQKDEQLEIRLKEIESSVKIENGQIETSLGTVNYKIYGIEKEKTPLFIVGAPYVESSYIENLKLFAKDRPVIFFDPVGSVESEKVNGELNLENLTASLEEFISRLPYSEYMILSHLSGSALSVNFLAERRFGSPKALIMISPILNSQSFNDNQVDLAKKLKSKDFKNFDKELKNPNLSQNSDKAIKEYIKEYYGDIENEDIETYVESLKKKSAHSLIGENPFMLNKSLKDLDLAPRLGEIPAPILFIGGDHDVVGVEERGKLRGYSPNSELIEIPNGKTFPFIDNLDFLIENINSYLLNKNL